VCHPAHCYRHGRSCCFGRPSAGRPAAAAAASAACSTPAACPPVLQALAPRTACRPAWMWALRRCCSWACPAPSRQPDPAAPAPSTPPAPSTRRRNGVRSPKAHATWYTTPALASQPAPAAPPSRRDPDGDAAHPQRRIQHGQPRRWPRRWRGPTGGLLWGLSAARRAARQQRAPPHSRWQESPVPPPLRPCCCCCCCWVSGALLAAVLPIRPRPDATQTAATTCPPSATAATCARPPPRPPPRPATGRLPATRAAPRPHPCGRWTWQGCRPPCLRPPRTWRWARRAAAARRCILAAVAGPRCGACWMGGGGAGQGRAGRETLACMCPHWAAGPLWRGGWRQGGGATQLGGVFCRRLVPGRRLRQREGSRRPRPGRAPRRRRGPTPPAGGCTAALAPAGPAPAAAWPPARRAAAAPLQGQARPAVAPGPARGPSPPPPLAGPLAGGRPCWAALLLQSRPPGAASWAPRRRPRRLLPGQQQQQQLRPQLQQRRRLPAGCCSRGGSRSWRSGRTGPRLRRAAGGAGSAARGCSALTYR
jgi:hypothetical protein